MRFNGLLLTLLFLTALETAACQAPKSLSPVPLTILPKECSLPVNGQIGLSLNGVVKPEAQVTWSAQRGLIVRNPADFGATYYAPSEPGMDQISVTILANYNGEAETLTLLCAITDDPASLTTEEAFPPATPLPTATPDSTPTVIISEVMSHPCGGDSYRQWNQYVELYNFGNQPVDVGGWFLYDEGEIGTPDEIAAWEYHSLSFDSTLTTNSTVIPPGGFAVILPTSYPEGPIPAHMPYFILPGTILLTVKDKELGDNYLHIQGSQPHYDTLTLYIGSLNVIHRVVDTYGTPLIPSAYPPDIRDNRQDSFPYYLSACTSIERIDPFGADTPTNWHPVPNGSPGDGPYH